MEAKEQYEKGLSINEKLVAGFPTLPVHRIDLGGNCCNFGLLVLSQGRAKESLSWFEKAIATLTPIHRSEPRDAKVKQFLRNSHWNRALAYDQLQNFADAVNDWGRAIELSPIDEQDEYRVSRAVSQLQAGQVSEAVSAVTELTKMPNWKASHWYNFACIYAVASGKVANKKQEYADRAMELLQQSVTAGWNDAAHMAKDGDLDLIRERKDFEKLLSSLGKGQGAF